MVTNVPIAMDLVDVKCEVVQENVKPAEGKGRLYIRIRDVLRHTNSRIARVPHTVEPQNSTALLFLPTLLPNSAQKSSKSG